MARKKNYRFKIKVSAKDNRPVRTDQTIGRVAPGVNLTYIKIVGSIKSNEFEF